MAMSRLLILILVFSFNSCRNYPKNNELSELTQAASAREPSEKMRNILNAIEANEVATEGINATIPFSEALTYASSVADPLIMGEPVFELIADWIETAESEIMIQLFKWEFDHAGHNKIIEAIKERKASSKSKLLIYLVLNKTFFESKVDGVFNDILKEAQLDSRRVEFRFLDLSSKLNAMHSKVLIKDGKEAFVTGLSLDKNFNISGGNWYDYAAIFKGQVAEQLRKEFLDTWLEAKRGVDEVKRATMEEKVLLNNELLNLENIANFELVENRPQNARDFTVFISTRRGSKLPNNNNDNPQNIGFIQTMAEATSHINILTPNLNDDAAKAAIIDAVLRGVKVNLHLTKNFNEGAQSELLGQGGGNKKNVIELYREIKRRNPAMLPKLEVRWMHDENGNIVIDDGEERKNCSHAKYMSIDGELMIVGSANMDTQSWNQSREVNLIVDDAESTERYDNQLFELVFERSKHVCLYEKEIDCPAGVQ
ncbi:MAG: phosphatidylserine/phosphatidylglycerophosphate/cardiolipin synthase family protein [Oligoflexales bacterium]|nr:phosphatidylserine/phosphatidylglycerophosphate/cardiolipin synthase family protein [Oligoflexales bacterium]